MIAGALMATVSCDKTYPDNGGSKGLDTITATFGSITRAYLSGLKSIWEESDQITISPMSDETATGALFDVDELSGSTAKFSGTFPSGVSTYYAFAPASFVKGNSWNVENKTGITNQTRIQASLPSVQNTVEITSGSGTYMGSDLLWFASKSDNSSNFEFNPVLAYLKVVVASAASGYKTVGRIELTASEKMSSTVTYVYYDDGASGWKVTFGGSPSTRVGIQKGTSGNFTSGTYYIAMAPRTYTGLVLKCYSSRNNSSTVQYTSNTISSVTLEAGKIYNLGTLPIKVKS